MSIKKGISKKGAIELSIGTVVIVVLAMSMLILGIILIRQIFVGTTGNVKEIDNRVKNEINKLFADGAERALVLYPEAGITLKQGESGAGFALSIRNIETGQGQKTYKYDITADPEDYVDCGTANPLAADGWARITVGKSGTNIKLANGNAMQNPAKIWFTVSKTAPICSFRVKVEVTDESNRVVAFDYMNIKIEPK